MRLLRLLVIVACALLGLLLAAAMLRLPPPAVRLAGQVASHLADSGVSSPVTAVLLNFRGYDTLLEVAVLLLAMQGTLASGAGREQLPLKATPDRVLQSMTRLLAPVMVLVAGYLLWAGAHRPGGAFQAAAVLAAAMVLTHLSGLSPSWDRPGPRLRAGLLGGLLVFLAVAALLLRQGALLQYPPEHAGMLILLIESGLTISLCLVLAGVFLWQPKEGEEQHDGD